MNLDSLITIAGLFIAVYAILPRARRLEISLKFGKFGWLTLLMSSMSILYLQFYQTFRILGLTPGLSLSTWSITTSNASFIIFLLMSLILYLHLCFKGFSRPNMVKFREYVFELSREKRYSELFSLIEGNVEDISRIYNSVYTPSKIHKFFERKLRVDLSLPSVLNQANKTLKNKNLFFSEGVIKLRRRAFKLFIAFLSSSSRDEEISREIMHEVLINRNTIKAIAEIRPYFALQILSERFSENGEFLDSYLRYLAEDTNSVLYHEVRNNRDLVRQDRYALPTKNRLLHYLFEDCSVAEKYGVYSPIGEFVISHLDGLYVGLLPDPYNEPVGDLRLGGQQDSQLIVGIRFFDIMVTSALYQNIQWHMWLYYYPHFVNRILRNIDPNEKLVDSVAEWPTIYHYALYEITSCLCKWATSVKHIPLDQENVILETRSANAENGNIPKSSMLAVGDIMKQVLLSEAVTYKFKIYITDIIYQGYFDLIKVDATKPYAEAFLNAIRCGGSTMIEVPFEYTKFILDAFEQFHLCIHPRSLSNEIREILKDDVRNLNYN